MSTFFRPLDDANKQIVDSNVQFLKELTTQSRKTDFFIEKISGQFFSDLTEVQRSDNSFYKANYLPEKNDFKIFSPESAQMVNPQKLDLKVISVLDETKNLYKKVLVSESESSSSATVPSSSRDERKKIKQTTFEINFQALKSAKNIGILCHMASSSLDVTPTRKDNDELLLFELIKKKLDSVQPLTEEDVLLMDAILSNPIMIKIYESKRKDESHVASLVYLLHAAFETGTKHSIDDEEKGFDHLNAVYFIKNEEGGKIWVFKPIAGEEAQKHMVKKGERGKREHLASVVNFHLQFPIPPTVYVNYRGQVGSLQKFVDGHHDIELEESVESSPDSERSQEDEEAIPSRSASLPEVSQNNVNVVSLQKLAVFDILFHNTDRNSNNYLFSYDEEAGKYTIKGIDNGECMGEVTRNFFGGTVFQHTNIEFLPYIAEQQAFDPSCRDLISDENVGRYLDIMTEHGIPKDAIDRTKVVAKVLRMAFDEFSGLSFRDVFEVLLAQEQQKKLVTPEQEGIVQSFRAAFQKKIK